MKKCLSVLISALLIISLVGCNSISGMNFESEKEMFDHLEGIWKHEEEYFLFSNGSVIEIGEYDVVNCVQDVFYDVVEEDYQKYVALTAEECMEMLPVYLERYAKDDEHCEFNYKRGVITFDKGFATERQGVVEGDTFKLIDGNNETTYEKISHAREHFGPFFQEKKEEWHLPLKPFIAPIQECVERIKKNHPGISSLTLVNEGDTVLYTDTGSPSNYNTMFMNTDSSVTYVKMLLGKKYTYTYDTVTKVALAHDATGTMSMYEVAEDALTVVSDFPNALSANELVERFTSEAKLSYGAYLLDIQENEIKYSVTKTPTYIVVRIEH